MHGCAVRFAVCLQPSAPPESILLQKYQHPLLVTSQSNPTATNPERNQAQLDGYDSMVHEAHEAAAALKRLSTLLSALKPAGCGSDPAAAAWFERLERDAAAAREAAILQPTTPPTPLSATRRGSDGGNSNPFNCCALEPPKHVDLQLFAQALAAARYTDGWLRTGKAPLSDDPCDGVSSSVGGGGVGGVGGISYHNNPNAPSPQRRPSVGAAAGSLMLSLRRSTSGGGGGGVASGSALLMPPTHRFVVLRAPAEPAAPALSARLDNLTGTRDAGGVGGITPPSSSIGAAAVVGDAAWPHSGGGALYCNSTHPQPPSYGAAPPAGHLSGLFGSALSGSMHATTRTHPRDPERALVVVDPSFKDQFSGTSVAASDPVYAALVAALPDVVIGTAEGLAPLVRFMCDEVRAHWGCIRRGLGWGFGRWGFVCWTARQVVRGALGARRDRGRRISPSVAD